jgi:hypothetical protein
MNITLQKQISGLVLTLAIKAGAVALPLAQPNADLNFQDIDAWGTTLSAGDSIAGTFDIVNAAPGSTTIMAGYDNAGAIFSDIGGYVLNTPIVSATAYFYVRNGNQGNDTIAIDLGSAQFFNSGAEDSFTIVDGAASISLLQSNGVISYSVNQAGTTGGSNFILDYAQLQVTTTRTASNGVPDGGSTLVLLGLGLAGIAFVSRKVRMLR